MNLGRYIQGVRKGRDINCLERKAMQNSFLADALEGYDKVKGNHAERMEEMLKQINQQTHPKINALRAWAVAALFLMLLTFACYFLLNRDSFSIDNYLSEKEVGFFPSASSSDTTKEFSLINYIFSVDSILKFRPFESFIKDTAKQDSIVPDEIPPLPNKNKDVEDKPLSLTPRPAVGHREYEKYLKKNLVRPSQGECSNINGQVILTFSVNGNGRPEGINILKSLCPSSDEEAIRLVKEGHGWTAGNKAVKVVVKF
jgi:hypothetical protein